MTGRGRAGSLTDQHYQAVAEVYWETLDSGDRATDKAVAETWDVPHTTAARWVREARRRGLMEPRPYFCSGRCRLHCPARDA